MSFEQIVTIASLLLSLLTVTASIVVSVMKHKSAVSIKLHEERISAYSKFLAISYELREHLINDTSFKPSLYSEFLLSVETVTLLCGETVDKLLVQLTSLIQNKDVDLFCKTISFITIAMKDEIKRGTNKNLFR